MRVYLYRSMGVHECVCVCVYECVWLYMTGGVTYVGCSVLDHTAVLETGLQTVLEVQLEHSTVLIIGFA